MNELDPKTQAFLEAAPDAIVVVDHDGCIVAVNRLTESMFRYPREQLLGTHVELLVPERFRGRHVGDRQSYVDSPRTRPMGLGRDLWGRRSNGEEFPVQISLSPIETEHGTLVTSIIRDVTVQHQAEARFRGLLESAPDGIVVVDDTGHIIIVNSQTERMFGYARGELLGRSIEILVPYSARTHHVSDRNSYIRDPHLRPMGAGRSLSGRRKDGSEFPVEISLSPLQTEQGSLVMSIVRDITERRRAEELIQASLREKEALLREIHHRVKNNLQVTSSLLRLQAGVIENPAAREVFAETQNRIRSMALVHEKLYQSTNLSAIDFTEYVKTLGELLFKSFAVDTNRIVYRVEGTVMLLSIDAAVPCGLIVNELLSNALKHAFPNLRKGTITVSTANNADGTRTVAVHDDGVGLPDQLNVEALSTLGLQLVRGLVQQIDATIAIERNGGTAFRIVLPEERART
ncbi:MAG TPA: PAS domain S-box protein [Thermoanaerobaculia bacterium]|nr:PAS domain S-box protein [Thermoanaerobaculia bacterium]